MSAVLEKEGVSLDSDLFGSWPAQSGDVLTLDCLQSLSIMTAGTLRIGERYESRGDCAVGGIGDRISGRGMRRGHLSRDRLQRGGLSLSSKAARRVPPRTPASSPAEDRRRPWYKFW